MKNYRDHYFKKAKQEHYPARSVYKLQELDEKFRLFKPAMHVLDLGASPGSWSLYAARRIGPQGRLLAVDMADCPASLPPFARFFKADVFSEDPALVQAMQALAPVDLVMSDMAPATTGSRCTDQARSLGLCERARDLAVALLAPGGGLVVKIFEGPDVKAYTDGLRRLFSGVRTFKPKSSRSESKETFIAALGFRGGIE